MGRMLNDFEMEEIDRLRRLLEHERERARTLIEMLHQVGVEVFWSPDGVTVTNEALEAPGPFALGEGYLSLGAAGT